MSGGRGGWAMLFHLNLGRPVATGRSDAMWFPRLTHKSDAASSWSPRDSQSWNTTTMLWGNPGSKNRLCFIDAVTLIDEVWDRLPDMWLRKLLWWLQAPVTTWLQLYQWPQETTDLSTSRRMWHNNKMIVIYLDVGISQLAAIDNQNTVSPRAWNSAWNILPQYFLIRQMGKNSRGEKYPGFWLESSFSLLYSNGNFWLVNLHVVHPLVYLDISS